LGAGFSIPERVSRRVRQALFLLAAADLGLILVVTSNLTVLADIIAPLTGHLIGIGLAASLALLVRRWAMALFTAGIAATLGLHAWLGLAWCCRAPVPTAQSGLTQIAAGGTRSLTVLALNTWDKHREPERLVRYLATAPADVVVLTEFGQSKRPLLAELKAAYPYQATCSDARHCSTALLSRLPLEESGVGGISAIGPEFVWARLEGSLTIVGTHVHRPSRNPWLHERQMAALGLFLRRIDGPVVLAGDLNTSPWSGSFRRLRAVANLASFSILTPTWPAWPIALPQVALDHILVSPELAVTASGTGPAVGSDHLPVWAQLERRAAPGSGPSHRHKVTSRLAAAGPHLGGEFLADLVGEHGGARDLRR